MSCFIHLQEANSNWRRGFAVGGYWLVDVPADARKETEARLRAKWLEEYVGRIPSEFPGTVAAKQFNGDYDARCTSYKSRGEWASYAAHVKEPVTSTRVLRSDFVPSFAQGWVSTREHARGYTGEVASSGGVKSSEPAGQVDVAAPVTASDTRESSAGRDQQAREAEAVRQAAREQREAEFQAKVAAHEAKVAEYERKVAARNAEIARQNKEHEAAQDAAARKMEAHRRKLDEANRRQQEYFAAQRRHALCVNGDRQACADIDAGKPAMGEQLASNEEPKTSDDDARTCVSRPVVSASGTFKGQTAAVVFNGCKAAVDVRVCLLRTGGWNCGVKWGLKPQDRWTHTSFETQGEIFWDARMNGDDRPLNSPEGT